MGVKYLKGYWENGNSCDGMILSWIILLVNSILKNFIIFYFFYLIKSIIDNINYGKTHRLLLKGDNGEDKKGTIMSV